jgi:biopolymer transport protein ExbD
MPRPAFHRRALSLTPLVDVIFLLLLFFMLTSTFSRYAEVEIAAATAGSGAQSGQTRFVQLGATRLRLAGRDVTLDALAQMPGDGAVLVSLEADVTAQRLIDLIAVLRTVPGLSVTVLQ